jgi:uncharacterized membrane protein
VKTRHFLNSVDHDKILAAIAKAEKGTTGEICVFVSRHNVANALAEAARCFKKLKMDRTALRNDVLIFVAPRSRKLAVIGDVGVHSKCGEQFWNEVVEAMRHRLKRGEFADALLYGIERVGSLLADHFPASPGAGKRQSGKAASQTGGVLEE